MREEEGDGRRQVGREIEGGDGITDVREIIIYLNKTYVKIVIYAVIAAWINAH